MNKETDQSEYEATGQPKHFELKLEGREWVLPSDPAAISVMLEQVCGELERRMIDAGWEESEVSGMVVAVQEAVTNAMVHGNLGVGGVSDYPNEEAYHEALGRAAKTELGQRTVHLTVDIERDRVRFGVRDDGPGFDVAQVPDPRQPANLLKPSGRGQLLMRAGSDIVGYNEQGNQVWLEKRKVDAPRSS